MWLFLFSVPPIRCGCFCPQFHQSDVNVLFSVPPIRCGCVCSLFHQSDVAVADGQRVAERGVTDNRTAGQEGAVQTDLLTGYVSQRRGRRCA